MPTVIPFFFSPEDERQFFSILAPFELTAYPNRIPPGWKPVRIDADAAGRLTEEGYYLAAEKLGEVHVRTIKRGKDRGAMEIDETGSPVMHYDRSIVDENGELRSGRLWTELNLTGDMQKNPAFPEAYRRMMLQLRDWFHTRCHRSDPPGFFIGSTAARLAKSGTTLREAGRKGEVLKVWR